MDISLVTMDSIAQQDRLSSLPDELLVLIISRLPFKECVRTSILSNRWRYLCLQTTNVSFKESEFVNPAFYNERSKPHAKIEFVEFMCRWVSTIQVIESFEICLSSPMCFLGEIEALVELAVRKQVKKLVLDFSNPNWTTFTDVPLLELPKSVYNLMTLESLKLCACEFDPSRLANPGILRSLYFGWTELTNMESLLSKSCVLENLSLSNCQVLDNVNIPDGIRELVIENCNFHHMSWSLDLPKLDIFKYSGDTYSLSFKRMNKIIKEVYLNFGIMGDYDEPNDITNVEGDIICDLLNDVRAAKTLTVCPYLLQVHVKS